MSRLTSTIIPEFSRAEITQMLSWLTSIARDESESRAKRKNACIASLSMAELFELGGSTNQRIGSLFVQFKNSVRLSENRHA